MLANGVLPVDKPEGCTSRQVVSAVGRAYLAGKAGHCGTLDPLATGVLVVCLGRATLISRYLAAEGKTYEVEALLGVETDTYDVTGKVIARSSVPALRSEELEELIGRFKGSIEQVPPPFSAVKVRGKPLYSYARSGIEVEAKPREVYVESIELTSLERSGPETLARLRITCGSGTYVRSLVHEIGILLGCGACVSGLRRTRAGRFSIEEAVPLDGLAGEEEGALLAKLTSLERATDCMTTATVSESGARGVRLGQPLMLGWLLGLRKEEALTGVVRVLDEGGTLLAMYGPPRDGDGEETAGRAIRVIRPVVEAAPARERGDAIADGRENAAGSRGEEPFERRVEWDMTER